MKKVLVITPRSPFANRGADEHDRLAGIEWFVRQRWSIRVITKFLPSDLVAVEEARQRLGIKIETVPYKNLGKKSLTTILKRLVNPFFWDGAAYEYFDSEIQTKVEKALEEEKPDLVWFDYTYLWPLYKLVQKKKIPIITRSINYEPAHFLDEDGAGLVNWLRSIPKVSSEKRALEGSNVLFAISPKEEIIYKKLGTTQVENLPLRNLPSRLVERHTPKNEKILLGFMPSTYTVHHNFEALKFIVEEVVPSLPKEIREKIKVCITGNKLPPDIKLPTEVRYEGFVPSSVDFWQKMDIALAPSLFGAGMQEKIFEPLCLGVPTITSERGLVGYPFKSGVHYLEARLASEYVEAIGELVNNKSKRESLSRESQKLARELFSETMIDKIISAGLQTIL